MSYIGTKPADQVLDSTLIAESTRLEEEAANAEQVKINAKTSALSKLAALGLTENEIKALTGTL